MWNFGTTLLNLGGPEFFSLVVIVLIFCTTIFVLWKQHVKLVDAKIKQIEELKAELAIERQRNETLHQKRYDDAKAMAEKSYEALASIDKSLERFKFLIDLLQGAFHRGQ